MISCGAMAIRVLREFTENRITVCTQSWKDRPHGYLLATWRTLDNPKTVYDDSEPDLGYIMVWSGNAFADHRYSLAQMNAEGLAVTGWRNPIQVIDTLVRRRTVVKWGGWSAGVDETPCKWRPTEATIDRYIAARDAVPEGPKDACREWP